MYFGARNALETFIGDQNVRNYLLKKSKNIKKKEGEWLWCKNREKQWYVHFDDKILYIIVYFDPGRSYGLFEVTKRCAIVTFILDLIIF